MFLVVEDGSAPTGFRACVPDDATGFAVEINLALLADLGYRGVEHYWESIIIRARDLTALGAAERALQIDSKRTVVEGFFGCLKRRFPILGDECFRLNPAKLEMVVTLCFALTNQRQRARGYALRSPPPGFVRCVPYPMSAAEIAATGGVIRAKEPPAHPPDLLTGLPPDSIREMSRDPSRQWPRVDLRLRLLNDFAPRPKCSNSSLRNLRGFLPNPCPPPHQPPLRRRGMG